MIVGPEGSGKTVLLNFLVGQARKFNSKVYYFGHKRSGKIFINALDGKYMSLSKDLDHAETLKMCPLSLKKTDVNKAFLYNWFTYLVNYGKSKAPEEQMQLIPGIVDDIIKKDLRKLSDAAELFNTPQTAEIYKKLEPWHGSGRYAFLFDHDSGINFETNQVNALDLTPILDKKPILIPVVSYVLHKIENRLDGTPAILVLDEAWNLIDNYATGPLINDFLKRLEQKNCIIIFATKSVEDAAQSNITQAIHDNITTQIYLPDPKPTKYYKTVFGLNKEEFQLLSVMNPDDYHFLLKHGEDSIIAALDLSKTKNITSILSANSDTLYAMDELKKKYGKDSKDWVPRFLELIENIFQKPEIEEEEAPSENDDDMDDEYEEMEEIVASEYSTDEDITDEDILDYDEDEEDESSEQEVENQTIQDGELHEEKDQTDESGKAIDKKPDEK
jgi:type IV secretion system protein VirB4